MTLDSEQQREMLLKMLDAIQISGRDREAVYHLGKSIETATVVNAERGSKPKAVMT